jgi:hypothetical protein
MKIFILVVICLFFALLNVKSQENFKFELNGKVRENIYAKLPVGTEVSLFDYYKSDFEVLAKVKDKNNNSHNIDITDLKKIDFEIKSVNDYWQYQCVVNDIYPKFISKGYQFKLRQELDVDYFEFKSKLQSNNLILNDLYVESYIYSLLSKLIPTNLGDLRYKSINLIIVKDQTPNAYIFSNGSMVINTGLLSMVNSEVELISVLAHEVAHYVLDHAIENINKANDRKRSAEFWAGFMTVAAAVTDVAIARKNPNYQPGLLTIGTNILSNTIANSIIERMGQKFSKEQEFQADICSKELLKILRVDENSLSNVLAKIKNYSFLTGNYSAILGEGTHPSFDERINKFGKSQPENDSIYDKNISNILTTNAIQEFNLQNFQSAKNLIERNIKSNMVIEEDYCLLSMINTFTKNTDLDNLYSLSLLEKAKKLNVKPNLNILKQEVVLYIRLKKILEAKNSVQKFKEKIESELTTIDKFKGTSIFENNYIYLIEELDWSIKMLHKINNM